MENSTKDWIDSKKQKAGHPIGCPVSFLERATRLELASRHPTNALRPFAGTLPHLRFQMRCAHGWRQRGSLLSKKQDTRLGVLSLFWSGLRGSNSLPPPWQGGALPDELSPREQERSYQIISLLSTLLFQIFYFFFSRHFRVSLCAL